MQTLVTSQQISHFSLFGWIEFEKFLSVEICASIQSAILDIITERLQTDVKKLSRYDQKQLYLRGRDIWRNSPMLQQIFCNKRCSATAANLTNKNPLLLAFDQWIPPAASLAPHHLSDHFSFQNLVCGCLLILDGKQAGGARFFQPDRLPLLGDSQILIAYGSSNTVYIHNSQDSLNADLKRYGYSFGDCLNARQNPLCKSY
jgi:hypothetical protein